MELGILILVNTNVDMFGGGGRREIFELNTLNRVAYSMLQKIGLRNYWVIQILLKVRACGCWQPPQGQQKISQFIMQDG